jgi:hypothetical protein
MNHRLYQLFVGLLVVFGGGSTATRLLFEAGWLLFGG